MASVTYKIVEHDGGWAYQVGDTFSETFATHDAAQVGAQIAAREQTVPGDNVGISFEDAEGHWHEEIADGHDRPKTLIKG
jgi:hypothetical protein